jgi:hypothetical protein
MEQGGISGFQPMKSSRDTNRAFSRLEIDAQNSTIPILQDISNMGEALAQYGYQIIPPGDLIKKSARGRT